MPTQVKVCYRLAASWSTNYNLQMTAESSCNNSVQSRITLRCRMLLHCWESPKKCRQSERKAVKYKVSNTAEDVTQFQSHLDALVTWSHKWQLYISSKKHNLLYCSAIDGPDMSIDGSVICKAHCVRDLGVLVDPHLKFMAHVNSVVSRAHTPSNLRLKCFGLQVY